MNQRRRIDRLLDKGAFAEARKQIRSFLRDEPENHWLMTRMAGAWAVEGKYYDALKWVKRALRRAPRCPIALWHLAYIYDGKERRADAARVLRRLIKRPIRSYLGGGECAQSRSWARDFITDCYMMLGSVEQSRSRHLEAARAYRQHIRRRLAGARGVIGPPLRQVRESLQEQESLSGKARG